MTSILAQTTPDTPWNTIISVMIGLVGLLTIAWLVFGVAIQWKKLFGKHPPVYQELREIRTEFEKADKEIVMALKDFQPKGDYLTRSEFSAARAAFDSSLQQISAENSEILSAGEKREQHIVERIDGVQKQMAELPAQFMAMMANAVKIANSK